MSVPANAPTDSSSSSTLTTLEDAPLQPGGGSSTSGTPDRTASSPDSQPASTPKPVTDWIREALRPRAAVEAPPTTEQDGSGTSEKSPQEQQAGAPDSKTTTEPAGATNGKIVLDEAELSRRVQAEVDRRESKREEKRLEKLRRDDPYAYAREMEALAQEKTSNGTAQEQAELAVKEVREYDRLVLDPLVALVPDSPEKTRALSEIPDGIDGRGYVFKSMLEIYGKNIRAQAMEEARKSLANDENFVKEILARRGGQRIEPEVVPSSGAAPQRVGTGSDSEMESFIRSRGRR